MRTAAKRELQRAELPFASTLGAGEVAVDPVSIAVLNAGLDGEREVASHNH